MPATKLVLYISLSYSRTMDTYKKSSKTYDSSDKYPKRFLHEIIVENIMEKLNKNLDDKYKWIKIKLTCDINNCAQIVCTTNIGSVSLVGFFKNEGQLPNNMICDFSSDNVAQTLINKFEALEVHDIVRRYYA